MSSKKILIGVLAGITTGTIIGVMLESKKNKALRKKLLKEGKRYSKSLKEKFNKSISDIQSNIDNLYKIGDHKPKDRSLEVVKKEE